MSGISECCYDTFCGPSGKYAVAGVLLGAVLIASIAITILYATGDITWWNQYTGTPYPLSMARQTFIPIACVLTIITLGLGAYVAYKSDLFDRCSCC